MKSEGRALVKGVDGFATRCFKHVRIGERADEIKFRPADGFGEIMTEREIRGDGGGKGAAGAVRTGEIETFAAETMCFPVGNEKVSANRAVEMAAFQEEGDAELFGQTLSNAFNCVGVGD